MSKIEEGEVHLLEARKYLKTGFLKWKPDYNSAAFELEKAANYFKSAKASERAKSTFVEAAQAFMECRQTFEAAKCYEQASIILFKEMDNVEECLKLVEKACFLFRQNGYPDTATLTYSRTAKMIEGKHPENAAKLYQSASESSLIEDRPQNAVDYANNAAKLLIRSKKFPEAINVLCKVLEQRNSNEDNWACGKSLVLIILLHLAMDDIVSANRVFQDGRGLLSADESYSMGELVEGYDNLDSKKIVDVLNTPFIKNLDNEAAKLARSLQEIQKEKIKLAESKEITEEDKNRQMEEGILL